MDREKYGQAAFRANKSARANAQRFCFETRHFLSTLASNSADARKAHVSFEKYLQRIELIVKGDHKLSKKPESLSEVINVFAEDEFPALVVANLHNFDFETCKELLNLVSRLIHPANTLEFYICSHMPQVVEPLINTYTSAELFLLCGQFLRELLQDDSIFQACLTVDILQNLVRKAIEMPFEIASDACDTIKIIIEADKHIVTDFINEHYVEVLQSLYSLCDKDYYCKRQALSILFHIVNRARTDEFKDQYVVSEDNLKYIMMLLKADDSAQVKVEAFQLFSVILKRLVEMNITNLPPYKIIIKNKARLLTFFERFQNDRKDEEFQTHKNEVIRIIRHLNAN